MFSHISIGVADFERAFAFHSSVMAALGHELRFCEKEQLWAGWQSQDGGRPLFIISKPFDGHAHAAGNGQMTAFLASSRLRVREVYAAAIAGGGSCEGEPGLRPQYHANYFGAYYRDTEGNKFCVACHENEPN